MTGSRLALTSALVLLAELLDVGVLDRLLVAGTAVDLLLLVVVAAALAGGSVTGATVGVCAGLLADVTPPAAGLLGVNALAYGLAGGVAGRWHRPGGRRGDRSIVLALAAAAVAAVLMTAVHLVFGIGTYSFEQAVVACAVAAAAAVMLGVVVLPALSALDRRLEADTP